MSTQPVPQKVPALPPSEAAAADAPAEDRAWAEAALFSRGAPIDDMEDEAKRNEHGRNQRFRNQFEYIAIASLWLASAAITIVGGIWLWHLVAPPQGRWLSTEDVSHLQSIVTAGLLVGVIGNHFKKRLS